MCCRVLQFVATWCSVLQCDAPWEKLSRDSHVHGMCCSCVAACCSCVAACCSCVTVCCSCVAEACRACISCSVLRVLQFVAVCCSGLQWVAPLDKQGLDTYTHTLTNTNTHTHTYTHVHTHAHTHTLTHAHTHTHTHAHTHVHTLTHIHT